MPNWVAKLQNPWLLRKLLMVALLAGVGVGAFFWGRWQQAGANFGKDPFDVKGGSDQSGRVVAYLYNDSVPVYRGELGEYLIQRFGTDRLEFMINRKIVEVECKKHDIVATDREVEERFQQELKNYGQNITEREFVSNILRRFGKTLYEWKEDVIRPKIMMEKYVKARITIEEKDIREGFDARYGPKVECRMIVCEADKPHLAQKVWENARKGPIAFKEEARKQFIPTLAAEEGKIPPIHKHFGDKDLEDTAFRLKEGDVGPVLKMKDGTFVILLCEKHLPAQLGVRYEDVRQELSKEMFELRIAQKIPETFAEMRRNASPRLKLDNAGNPSAEILASTQPRIDEKPVKPQAPVVIPPPPVPQPIVPEGSQTPLPDKLQPTGQITLPPVSPPALPSLTPTSEKK